MAGAHRLRLTRSQQGHTWSLVTLFGKLGEGLGLLGASSGLSRDDLGRTSALSFPICQPGHSPCNLPVLIFEFIVPGVGGSGDSWADLPWSGGNKSALGRGPVLRSSPRVRRKPGHISVWDPPGPGSLLLKAGPDGWSAPRGCHPLLLTQISAAPRPGAHAPAARRTSTVSWKSRLPVPRGRRVPGDRREEPSSFC